MLAISYDLPLNERVPATRSPVSPVTDLTQAGAELANACRSRSVLLETPGSDADRLLSGWARGHRSGCIPLFADLTGLPRLRVHVGNHEVLLDDSIRFVERAVSAGVEARLDVWEGMVHGFLGRVGRLEASSLGLQSIGAFFSKPLLA